MHIAYLVSVVCYFMQFSNTCRLYTKVGIRKTSLPSMMPEIHSRQESTFTKKEIIIK